MAREDILIVILKGSLPHEHCALYTTPRILDLPDTADGECALMPTPPRYGGGWPSRGVFGRDNEPLYRAQWHVTTYHDYLARALEEGTTPNGFFGAKVGAGVYLAHFVRQLRTLPQFSDATLSQYAILSALFPDLKCIWLTRRHKVQQAVSWWKAVQSNVWVQHTMEAPRPAPQLTYHFAAIDQLVNESVLREAAWAECFAAWQITPLTIVYEDFIADYAGTVAHMLRYLEVRDPYVLDETAITLAKQADSLSEAWVQQYREEKQQHWPNRAW